jgi:hypothetical protein
MWDQMHEGIRPIASHPRLVHFRHFMKGLITCNVHQKICCPYVKL